MTYDRPDAAALAERRRRRLWLIGASFVLVVVLVGIGIALGGSGDEAGTTTGTPEGVAEVGALYDGIPQRGIELGDPRAPATLTEYADLQCPFCGKYGREVLPTVVARYVRAGKLRLVFRGLDFIGEDSTRLARMAAAAGMQNRLYQFVDLVYRNQGAENAGWADDDYLRRVGTAARLDVDRAFDERDGPRAKAEIGAAKAEGKRAQVESTPWFVLQRRGEPAERLDPGSLDVGAFTEALDSALAGD